MDITSLSSETFALIRAEWNDLLSRSVTDSVFLRWEWIHTWWDVFKQNKKLLILIARLEGRLVGIAPFYIDRTGFLGLRTLRFCSEELSPDYLDVIAESGREEEVTRHLVNGLFQRSGQWDLIVLDNLSAESHLLTDPALFRDCVRASRVSHQCPYIKIEGTFDDYYQPRTQLSRFGFKKKLKVLLDQKKVTHHVVSDEQGLAGALDDLFALHKKRSRLKNIQSNFLSPEVRRFHHKLSRLFFHERILSLQLLQDGKAPISAVYAFNYKNKIFVFQIAFDPDWSKWSAGAVLIYFCVQSAFENGLREFDWLKGTESYKSFWADAVRDEMQLTVYNRNLRGSVWRAWNSLKSALKKIENRLATRKESIPLRHFSNADLPATLGNTTRTS